MNEYAILTNRLERIKRYQRYCIDSLTHMQTKRDNDYFYSRFCRACEIANELLSRMVNIICDKEGIGNVIK